MDQGAVEAQQVALYGEPLGARFARLTSTYRISQARLASVIGLSPPMLSQLATAQRVKIGNPAVYARLLRLEELAASSAMTVGDPGALTSALESVADSRPSLTTQTQFGQGRSHVVRLLSEMLSAQELQDGVEATTGRLKLILEAAAAERGS